MSFAPRSFTRQDLIELHVPGSPIVAAVLNAALVELGARQAIAGEFTARAFFSGRIDLSQAEAVADVVNAADDAQLRSSIWALGGEIHRLCKSASTDLAEVLALVEASIDLEEEGIIQETPFAVASRLKAQAEHLRRLAQQAWDLPDTAAVPTVVIAGRANVGKSSLLNAMTSSDRAIVSALAGTTRDVLSATMMLDGGSVLLHDAAGFAQADNGVAHCAEQAASDAIARADAIIFVMDLSAPGRMRNVDLLARIKALNPRAALLEVANKADLLDQADLNASLRRLASDGAGNVLAVSAVTGSGLDRLKHLVAERIGTSACRSGQALGLHHRQKQCLLASASSVLAAADLLAGGDSKRVTTRLGTPGETSLADSAELVAVELREALAQIALISGQVVNEDILGIIFQRFCVGK